MNLRRINRATHRDLGYFFTGMIIIYALSGIALNHRNDWNPNYSIKTKTLTLKVPSVIKSDEEEKAVTMVLKQIGEEDNYRKHYFPADNELKIFLKGGGSVDVNLDTGKTLYEKLKKRPVFFEVNLLHYNPGRLWTWFSDTFSVALIILGITGLFILKGKNGITGRGAWLTIAGIIIPLIFLFMYL